MKRIQKLSVILFCTACICLFVSLLVSVLSAENASVTASEQTVIRKKLTDGQKHIVKRAYQMTDIEWTPEEDIYGWGNGVVYKAGTTYRGLPYGQPVYASYVPWTTSLDGFISAVGDKSSKMYTDFSSYNKRAPYYSVDCSAFVSWAWELDSRQTTSLIKYFATEISRSSFRYAEVGDCLCLAGNHVVLITDITYYENDEIRSIEISEATTNKATSYCCQKVIYGEGGQYTLEELTAKYFGKGYILYRSDNRYNVSYYHSCAVPLAGDKCKKCGYGYEEVPCQHSYESGICINCGKENTEAEDDIVTVFDAALVLKIFEAIKKIIAEIIKQFEYTPYGSTFSG